MTEQDEDVPPALASLPSQRLAAHTSQGNTDCKVPMPSASVTLKGVKAKPAPIKSGFLNSKTCRRSSKPHEATKGKDETAPFIKASQHPKVPDMFMLPPDAQEKQYTAVRQKLVSDLMPTEQSIGNIASNKELMAGFDDPKVMQAVSDVAQNPANINKYKNNKKVQRFYQQMGGVMAARCNELGAVQSRQGKTATKAQQKSTQSMQMLSKPQQKRSAAQCKIEEL